MNFIALQTHLVFMGHISHENGIIIPAHVDTLKELPSAEKNLFSYFFGVGTFILANKHSFYTD